VGKGNDLNLALRSLFVHTWKWFFKCHKILRHGAPGFTFPPKEDLLWNFITLKIHHLSWVWTHEPWM
jgi:hypothetical protein